MQTRGERISLFIQDSVKNGAGKLSARNLFLDSLKEYLSTTSNFEEAERIIHLLPSMVNLSGLGALGDVNALKNDFDKLKEDLENRKVDFDARKIRKQDVINKTAEDNIFASLDKFEDFEEYKNSTEYANLSAENQKKAQGIYANHFSGYAQKTNDQSRSEVEELIKKSDFVGARKYLVDNQSQFKEAEFNKIRNEVLVLEKTNDDGLITHELFEAFQQRIETNLTAVNKASPTGSPLVSPALGIAFEKEMRQWLSDNPKENFATFSAREEAFLNYVEKRERAYQNVISQNQIPVPEAQIPTGNEQGSTGTNTEVFDPNKLGKKTEPEASEVSVPVNKITNNGKPFTNVRDIQKLMTQNLQGKDIKRLYDNDFPINDLSIFSQIKD